MTVCRPDKRYSWRPGMKPAQKWLVRLGITASADVVSYLWLDRPIARFAHEHLHQYDLFAKLTYIPEINQSGRDPCFRGYRALGLERACALETADSDGTGGRQLGGYRGAQDSAQARFRPHLAGDVGAQQPLLHSRRRLRLQPVPRRAPVSRRFPRDILPPFALSCQYCGYAIRNIGCSTASAWS